MILIVVDVEVKDLNDTITVFLIMIGPLEVRFDDLRLIYTSSNTVSI